MAVEVVGMVSFQTDFEVKAKRMSQKFRCGAVGGREQGKLTLGFGSDLWRRSLLDLLGMICPQGNWWRCGRGRSPGGLECWEDVWGADS